MHYDYNKKAFRTLLQAADIDPLIAAYGGCVLIELALKQALDLTSSMGNGGHNLGMLIDQMAQRQPKQKINYDALKAQLNNSLKLLFCQGRKGIAQETPTGSYPHIRYLRHTSDWNSDCNTDDEIKSFYALIQRIINHLSTKGKISI